MADLAYLRRIAFSTKPVRHEHLRDALAIIDGLRTRLAQAGSARQTPAPSAQRLERIRAQLREARRPGIQVIHKDPEVEYSEPGIFDSLDSDDLESLAASGSVWLP